MGKYRTFNKNLNIICNMDLQRMLTKKNKKKTTPTTTQQIYRDLNEVKDKH